MPKGRRGPAPAEKQCRATTPGMKVRGAYWSPPHRCGNYAAANGYCWQHRPGEGPAGDDPREPAARAEPDWLAALLAVLLAAGAVAAAGWAR